jgi:hypothetical protein
VSGKPLDQPPPPAWPRLIDLPAWVERATQRLLPPDSDSLDLELVMDAVWDVLDTQPTFLRLVFSKSWDADRLQSFEYLKINRRAGTAKVQVRGRIADGDGREDKRGWQVIARLLGLPANNWVQDAYDLEKRFSRRRPFVLEFDRRAMEAIVLWLLTGRQPVAALAAPRMTQEVVLKAVSPELLEKLRLLFQSVQSPPRQSRGRKKSDPIASRSRGGRPPHPAKAVVTAEINGRHITGERWSTPKEKRQLRNSLYDGLPKDKRPSKSAMRGYVTDALNALKP